MRESAFPGTGAGTGGGASADVRSEAGRCADARASSEAFCSSSVLMLICIIERLIASQFSMTLSSAILRSISAGSSAANIAAGLGKPMPGGAGVSRRGAGQAEAGHRARPADSTSGCRKASASCGVNGNPGGLPA